MAEKRMACARCPRYDRELRRCRDGKANPKKKSDTITVAEIFGVRALCCYNPYREALAIRMYHPDWPTLALAKSRRLRRLLPTIEVEIMEDDAENGGEIHADNPPA